MPQFQEQKSVVKAKSVACAMAAGLASVGFVAAQCANAAEIGIEHNLGLTCDPIMVAQVPCIERGMVP